ncbi:MAG: TetR/AcrR family transcriptional regulator [Bacillota bacterium]
MVNPREDDGTRTDMRRSLLEAALALIDEAEGCRGVTLRAIAARAGCAHTNVYNYFPSLERLFWESLLEAQRRGMEFIGQRVAQAVPGSPEVFRALVSARIEFALTHPGWYRLMWLEPLGDVPPELVPRLRRPREEVSTKMIGPLLGTEVRQDEARRITDILHSYVHGEICKLITQRDLADREPSDPRRIEENALMLLRLLGAEIARTTAVGKP